MDGNMSRRRPSPLPHSCLLPSCLSPSCLLHTPNLAHLAFLSIPITPPLFPYLSFHQYLQKCPPPSVSLVVMLVCWCSGGYCPKCALMVSLMATSTIRRPPPTRGRPTPVRPPIADTRGEFTRLHHVMLILITVLFSSYQAHRNSCLSQNLQPFQEPFMVIAAPGSVKISKL